MVDNDLICESLIIGILNNGVCKKNPKIFWYDLLCFHLFVAHSILAVLTANILLVEAAV